MGQATDERHTHSETEDEYNVNWSKGDEQKEKAARSPNRMPPFSHMGSMDERCVLIGGSTVSCAENFEAANEFGHEEVNDEIPEVSRRRSLRDEHAPQENEHDGVERPAYVSQVRQVLLRAVQAVHVLVENVAFRADQIGFDVRGPVERAYVEVELGGIVRLVHRLLQRIETIVRALNLASDGERLETEKDAV